MLLWTVLINPCVSDRKYDYQAFQPQPGPNVDQPDRDDTSGSPKFASLVSALQVMAVVFLGVQLKGFVM